MIDIQTALLWCVAQVTLVALGAALAYTAARRRAPATRSALILATLITIVGVSALAFSPWPRWQIPLPNATHVEDGFAPSTHGAADQIVRDQAAGKASLAPPLDAWNSFDSAIVGGAVTPRIAPPIASSNTTVNANVDTAARWGERLSETWAACAAWLPWALAVGVAASLARLAVGIGSVAALRRRSTPIDDEELQSALACLSAQLALRAPVALRESRDVGTPVATGWRHPTVLLPPQWRGWNSEQRRAILAHELAHVARGDCMAVYWAQLVGALHFYHPVVRWLVGRFRLEQELAADLCGAVLSGGSQQYLTTLAHMALHADGSVAPWPARAFLPRREPY